MQVSPVPSPTFTPISEESGKKLLKEFTKAQSAQLKALAHRQKLELKELKASQTARKREWIRKEGDARHQFFKENNKSAVRRTYIQDYLARRDALDQFMKDEYKQRAHEQDVRYKSLKDEQAAHLEEFKAYLSRGLTPSQSLWPQPGQ